MRLCSFPRGSKIKKGLKNMCKNKPITRFWGDQYTYSDTFPKQTPMPNETDVVENMPEPIELTTRQRSVQEQKLRSAMGLLEIAAVETRTAMPDEIAQTVDVALEIITKVNNFLKSRGGDSQRCLTGKL